MDLSSESESDADTEAAGPLRLVKGEDVVEEEGVEVREEAQEAEEE